MRIRRGPAVGILVIATVALTMSSAQAATTWKVAAAPLPSDAVRGADDAISGVACPAENACVFVGTYTERAGTESFTAGQLHTIVGARTTTRTAPLPVDAADGGAADVRIGHVACAAAGSCVAVGSYRSANGAARPLVETLAHGRWTASAVPLPDGAAPAGAVELDQVACNAATCVAFGLYSGVAPQFQPLVLVRSGGHWQSTGVAGPVADITVSGVACPPSGACVGYGTAGGRAVLVFPSVGTWRAVYLPVPVGVDQASLEVTDISCAPSGTCSMLGSYAAPDARGRGVVVDTLRNGVLSALPVRLPAAALGHSVRTGAISCPGVGVCAGVATVARLHTASVGGALVLHRTNGAWTPLLAPLPAVAPGGATSYLQDVSCSSPTSCTAVGGFDMARSHGHVLQRPFTETLRHGRWSAGALGRPAGVTGDVSDGLFQVSCAGSRCEAAGSFEAYRPSGSVRDLGGFVAGRD